MHRLFRAAAVLALLAVNLALAQDATKTEPRHYKLAFENDKVQVVYVQYGPHEKSRVHSHPQGVVVNITAAHLLFTDEDGKVHEIYSKPGEARWFPPFRHTVENLGDTVYSGVYIGVKGGPSASHWPGQTSPHLDEQAAGQMAGEMARIFAAYLIDSVPSLPLPSASSRVANPK